MLKYSYPQEVYQEVPGEISLALSISGCNLNCIGCHSSETWDKDFGKNLTFDEIRYLLTKYKYISCILFYGGEWEIDYLTELFAFIKKNSNIKIALYTGQNISFFSKDFLINLDYIKVGYFNKELGSLTNKNTNQRFFVLNNGVTKEELFFY